MKLIASQLANNGQGRLINHASRFSKRHQIPTFASSASIRA
jgi:hypothetical protein